MFKYIFGIFFALVLINLSASQSLSDFQLSSFKGCMDAISKRTPNVKECYDNFDRSKMDEFTNCVKTKVSSMADQKLIDECVPQTVRNFFKKN